jgi:hypothetical protein
MPDFARIFSMGCFEGLRRIRQHQKENIGRSLDDALRLLAAIDPDAGALDFESGCSLDEHVNGDAPCDQPILFYRACIEAAIIAHRPVWLKVVTRGRQKLLTKLSRDEVQCFREAMLLSQPAEDDVIDWWDLLASNARQIADLEKLFRARQAEMLSLQYEKLRLARLGINKDPEQTYLEDNTAGYDIKSYDPGPYEPVARLIEVKSTIASPLRFRLTRNEWDAAIQYGAAYHFHIWDLAATPPRLHEKTMGQIARHIPTDNERGRWQHVEVPVIAS